MNKHKRIITRMVFRLLAAFILAGCAGHRVSTKSSVMDSIPGFSNLSQIKTMYGVDVMPLVSYDQVQFTDEEMLSLSYWIIIGAYVVSGEKNDTNTLLDTIAYDIDSKKLLFRAPGTSHVTGSSNPVNLSEKLRADGLKGFDGSHLAITEAFKVIKLIRRQGQGGKI